MLERPTSNSWLDWYMYAAGYNQVPQAYWFWSGMSLLAAACTNRIWFEGIDRIFPNLYIILVGPSGTGKDTAINLARKIALLEYDGERVIPDLNLYNGKATIQYLLDRMGRVEKDNRGNKRMNAEALYLQTPELAMSIGFGPQAFGFVQTMTGLYSGADYPFEEGTRGRGGLMIKTPCINWIGGSTKEWLVSSIPRVAIEGGFLARVLLVEGKYDFSKRVRKPWFPPDRAAIIDMLAEYLKKIMTISGSFELDAEADALDDYWYNTREDPTDDAVTPTWMREWSHCMKLSMLFSLSEGSDGIIRKPHLAKAQQCLTALGQGLPNLLAYVQTTPETEGIEIAENRIRLAGEEGLTRTALIKYMTKKGYGAQRLDTEIMPALLGSGTITEARSDTMARIYTATTSTIAWEEEDES